MKCYFCRQELSNAMQYTPEHRMFGVCTTCPHTCTTYSQFDDLEKISLALISFEHKGIHYTARFEVDHNEFHLNSRRGFEDGSLITSHVMSLYFTPKNITPHNIIKKLPSLILYS
jgi:hypothetical protein